MVQKNLTHFGRVDDLTLDPGKDSVARAHYEYSSLLTLSWASNLEVLL